MTVSTTTIVAGPYPGNGSSDTFAYDWKIWDKSQVKVYETDDSGTVTVLTVDTDYTVGSVGVDGGGDITRVAGNLPTNYEWLIVSNFLAKQETDFASQGNFSEEVHENAFDLLTRLVQQISEVSDRTLQLPQTSQGISVVLPTPQAGYLIGWDDDGDALASLAPTDTLVYVGGTAPDETVFQLWYDSATMNFKFWDGAAWQSTSGTDITGKADRDTDAVEGNLAEFDANGHPVDSGSAVADFADAAATTAALAGKEGTLATGSAADITGDDTTPKKFAGDQINSAIDTIVAAAGGGTPDADSVGHDEIGWGTNSVFSTSSTSWVVPEGLHIMSLKDSGGSGDAFVDVHNGTAWQLGDEAWGGGAIYSDGINVRLRVVGGSQLYTYRKLG